MADLSKLKKRLGEPPRPEETKANLAAPETAPTGAAQYLASTAQKGQDGRSARRTGRTRQFATRVSEAFDDRFRAICKRDRLLMTELLEKALDAYEDSR